MIELKMPITQDSAHILTRSALDFVEKLAKRFEYQRLTLLQRRREFDALLKKGKMPNFRDETREIRKSDWVVDAPPADLRDRRVEITGPSGDAKMVINAFNSGAKVYMTDFEDSQSPTWNNNIQGQVNLHAAVRGTLVYVSLDGAKTYKLNDQRATLMVRPRGLHLTEDHVTTEHGMPVSASLFDFGLFFFHNAKELLARRSGPYFYLPKIEHYEEAVWWAQVFAYAEELLGVEKYYTKATVLIETITAAFQMDEIINALGNYSVGLNCGRWDYIFSFIKKLGHNPKFIMPDRSQIGMDQDFLKLYAELLVETCDKRGVYPIGGMSACIPIKGDMAANAHALVKVREDKMREVRQGFKGTWVAHPGLVPVALEIFDKYMPTPKQLIAINRLIWTDEVKIIAEDLLQAPMGQITTDGVLANVLVAIIYIESWLRGIGCVPINNLMEDLATAEISRIQLWQWMHHHSLCYPNFSSITVENHTCPVDMTLFEEAVYKSLERIKNSIGYEKMLAGGYLEAVQALRQVTQMPEPPEFLSTYLLSTLMAQEGKHND